jgi:K+-transporting ATPase A subunit
LTFDGWLQIAFFTVAVALLVRPLGGYMMRVFRDRSSRSAGTLPTSGSLFVMFLVGVICIVGGLTFLPALSLGPIAEQVMMQAGRLY